MSLNSGVQDKLHNRIAAQGFHSVIPCNNCVRLYKICIKSELSARYSECVRGGGKVKCTMSRPTYTDADWRKLVKMQQDIASQRKKALAQVMRLEQQEALLRERAGDFIARDYKEIAELEELER